MAGRNEVFDADLADRGDDRPGVDELEGDDFSALDADRDPEADLDELDEGDSDDADDDDDDEDDYPEDATADEIDIVAALYHEDGRPSAIALPKSLANDLDGLIGELRRTPGEAGALGVVSIDSDFFVLVRVRGRVIQLVLSDSIAANDWPLAREAADFLGVDIPDDEDESEPIGDLDLFADAGLSELELEALCGDEESEVLESLEAIVERLGFADAYDKVATSFGL